ncbi:phage holin family protein [Streptomyces mobaraensis NBRC 13819 = DSM 40847]|uniref:Membrane protein n=1 Tax=Streptomyces mobaraensis (strain ATCC 29032 / DSM 40847 / JCM 4168 / NBRC 13819 / NCIMB 11159 / IPCR 16-22) TaxID=1223523 RepID=M3A172_STRM1|nr:phage holin family protein [Streptomyces mobaraensis]EME98798.1 membrane protein [Streptomyces mobaraensis NBRC 13819 = DSM 40847]QTT74762.1 phage holin family protein [Streptomyces mobaraensis NBRC 13819 = DSM 40847]
MKNFVVKTIANAAALAVAIWLLKGITLAGETTAAKAVTLLVVALLFGLVNFLVKPVVKLLSFPLFILTLGLITLVINALMLLLTSWLAGKFDLAFHVGGFGPALVGGVIISIVAWAMHVILPDDKD